MNIHEVFLSVSIALFGISVLALAVRLVASDGARRLREPIPVMSLMQTGEEGDNSLPLDDRYRELIELGMIGLEPDEIVVAGCGQKGEIEEILLFTNKRAFIMNRRSGATFFAKHTFVLKDLRPVPSSAGLVGNKIILTDGAQTRAIDSPGDHGFLASASVVIRELNSRIRAAQHDLG